MNGELEALEQLGAQCSGDVPAMIASARTLSPVFNEDATLARAFEAAAQRRAHAGDRGAVWWLACAVATLRASGLASAQEDAELIAARVLGEITRSPAALAALPEGARWLVAAHAEPPPTAHAIELARKNATTYLERLDAELEGRERPMTAKWQQAQSADAQAAIEEVLTTYARAVVTTRAALSRVVDHIAAKSADPALGQLGAVALQELDDNTIPPLRTRIDGVRSRIFGGPAPAPHAAPIEDRPSFAGAAPPAFQPGAAPPSVEPPRAVPREEATIDQLDAAMRAAFERAWASGDAESRAAFEAAVRARYARETESIPDEAARQQALDHYVAHALAQLPQR
jgi:hypothetical protein